ncbi:probable helicase senataxin isoform X2 [Eublepharis macularius]|uniref:Probable helicase senataxin isoform X2 n=1 Tax=Eublepharis macularius TaxID=481883 RepID=A0AA97LFE9_EUBMA|nr:probable helicase senataxin isoform X2 [Eublepharis macularius]
MSTCCWCTPGGVNASRLLQSYASEELSSSELTGANDDLCYCVECVDEYHKARDKVPSLQKILWKLETSRLVDHLEKTMQKRNELPDLYIIEGDKATPCCAYTSSDLERDLSIPLLEILKHPYLLLSERLSELFVEALFEVEKINYSYEVTGKHPGIYLLVVHPNEHIRRWAIRTATNLGEVDRDDYYDIQEVFTCLFKVIELGLFENPHIYNSAVSEEGKLILLPPHLYDTGDHKSYWLGICMLLTVLEEQAMDSLLLGPEKQNDFMQSILSTMEKHTDDDKQDPFWPALQCFMVILNRLGSKVWGQLIDPVQAFQTIVNSPSYKNKIKRIRQSCRRTKTEPLSDYENEMITSSQIVYNYYTEKPQKETGWKTVWSDCFRNLHEDMQALASMLQSDSDQEEHWHSNTFLWFIPFVHSLMDLKSVGVPYIMEVIRYLCSEINEVFREAVQYCDKVSESFILILVSVVQLHFAKECLHLLWVSSQAWVEAVVKCAKLPSAAIVRSSEGTAWNFPRAAGAISSQGHCSVQLICMKLIRSLLKEAYQQGQQASCKFFLDKLNLLLRNNNVSQGWQLSAEDTSELQVCLKKFIKSINSKQLTPSSHGGNATASISSTLSSLKQEKESWDERYPVTTSCEQTAGLPLRRDESCQEGPSPKRVVHLGEEHRDGSCRDQTLCKTSECLVSNIKQEPDERSVLEGGKLGCSNLANGHKNAQNKEYCCQDLGNQRESDSSYKNYFNQGFQDPETKDRDGKEVKSKSSKCLPVPEKDHDGRSGGSGSEVKTGQNNMLNVKVVLEKLSFTSKLKQFIESNKTGTATSEPEAEKQQCLKDGSRHQEEQTSGIMATSLSNVHKQELSLGDASEDKELYPKKISKDGLAECRGSSQAEDDLKESSSDDENIPYSKIRKKLRKNKSAVAAIPSADSQIDRDLSRLSLAAYAKGINFPVDSGQASAVREQSCIQRKVGGAFRSCSGGQSNQSSSDTDEPCNQVIIISDSSSDEDKNKVNVTREREREKRGTSLQKQFSCELESARGQELTRTSSSPLPYEDYDSQCFEFETEDDMYSVWQEYQEDENAAGHPEEQDLSKNPKSSHSPCDLETGRQTNDRDYDTDYLGEEAIERAAEAFEQQVILKRKDSKAEATPDEETAVTSGRTKHFAEMQANDGGCSRHDGPPLLSPSASITAHEKSNKRPRKSSTKSQLLKTANKKAEKGNASLNAHNRKSPQIKSSRSAPAVVPPKKIHNYPQPRSTVEKLGLKKAPRQAAELSQRSLDSLAELRSYGKAAGELDVPQQRKSKLIPPQSLVHKNRKMLACQDLQFYRQSRPKLEERVGRTHGRNSETQPKKLVKKADAKQSVPQGASGVTDAIQKERAECFNNTSDRERKQHSLERKEVQPPPVSAVKNELPSQPTNFDTNVAAAVTTFPGNLGSVVAGGTKMDLVVSSFSFSSPCDEAVSKETESKLNKDSGEDNDLFLTQRAPEDMEICSQMENGIIVEERPLQGHYLNTDTCKHAGCVEKVSQAGAYCIKHAVAVPLDHVFAKPLAPKPPTAKIFSSSSSRSANLTKDLEHIHKPSLTPKSKPTFKMDDIKRLSFMSILGPRNSNSDLQNVPSNHIAEAATIRLTSGIRAGQKMHPPFPQGNHFNTQKRDHSIFNKEVLKWNYDMFARFSQFGVPESLLQSIVAAVPVRFQGYNDYFDTFFPLTMLNAFETVAQEWQENQKLKVQKEFLLKLLNLSADSNGADFTADIQERDLEIQAHPKESDLVFLKVSRRQNPYSEEGGMEIVHVGLVTHFSQPSVREAKKKEQRVACRLSIQTQGSLAFINKEVRCVVVSSLVTTQRRFKALLLLSRSPLSSSIYNGSYANFSPEGLNVDSENAISDMAEYNEDQKRAIETAYTMVSSPLRPQICLIHGPPGTGKSKTIIGLLFRILAERSGKENPMHSLNAKIKRNRVLVCAPSNAAVDDLMKKIILFFKEKCQDKGNPLGNCGDINLVRLGQEKSISKEVRKFSLNDQIKYRMNRGKLGNDQDLHRRKEELDQRLDMLSRQRAMERKETEKKQQLDEEICKLSRERERLAHQLKEVRGWPQEMKTNIILESHIICCTLSTSGGVLLESAFRKQSYNSLSCIIVDEAGQACEVETLIPFIHGCRKLVLVGDPKQLPPTVISVKAQDYGYDQSLMGRLCRHLEEQVQQNGIRELPVLQLTTQYRMHPDICLFPSNYIYGRSLKTDRLTEENRCSSKWPFQSYLLFDVRDGQELRESDSFANPQEVKLVIELMKVIKHKKKQIGFHNIGIITPYNAQKRRILRELDKTFGENRASEVDTVDGFQGREKDCIIVTCVRANSTQGSIGFLKSLQRLNVTITRAKYSLFILGQLKTLMDNKDWNELIQDAQRRGTIVKTSHDSYKKDATKILKLMPMPQRTRSLPGGAMPERTPQGPAGTVSNEQKEVSSHKDSNSWQHSVNTCTSAEVSHRFLGLPGSHISSQKPPLSHQMKSAQERPQDPRLARRAQAEQACMDNRNPAPSGSGVALPRGLDAPPGQRNCSNNIRPVACKTEAPGKPVATTETKRLGRGDQHNQPEWKKGQDCVSRGKKASEDALESGSLVAAKKRRTTY